MSLVTVAPLALALSLAAQPGDAGVVATAAPALWVAAAPYWPLSEKAEKERARRERSEKSEKSDKARKPPPRHASPGRADPPAKSTAKLEDEVFGDDDDEGGSSPPTARRSLRPIDDDSAARTQSLPVIAPHTLTFGLGGSLIGRSFGFNSALQRESTFPRGGMVASLEAYPLLWADGRVALLGLGASFEREIGSAGLQQADGGTLDYPVGQGRWDVDLRYAIPLGDWFVLVPFAGYGQSGYDVRRRVETTAPSMCASTATQVCLPDVALAHLTVGASARFALTPLVGMSLTGAFLPAFGVGRAPGQLASEAAPAALGASGELALTWQLAGWLSLRAALPLTTYHFSWSGPTVPYRSASETYYGLVAGATVFTR